MYMLFWIALAALLLALGLTGVILSKTQLIRNDQQMLLLFIMDENVTYLDFRVLFDTTGITELVLRMAPIPNLLYWAGLNITYMELETTQLENIVQVLQNDVLIINYTLTVIRDTQQSLRNQTIVINDTLTIVDANITALANDIALQNASLLYTVNGVTPDNATNIDLVGICGLQVYPSVGANATLVLDTCSLEAQLLEIDANFTAAVIQFLNDTVMSNITVDTINFQWPIAGNIDLIGQHGIVVDTSVPNQVTLSNSAAQTFSGVAPNTTTLDIQLVPGTPLLQIDQTGPANITIGLPGIPVASILQINTGPGVVDVNSTPNGPIVTLGGAITVAEPSPSARMSCQGSYTFAVSPANTTVVWGFNAPLQLTPNTVVRPCKYQVDGPVSGQVNLNEAGAVFLIDFHFYSTQFWRWDKSSVNFFGPWEMQFLWCITASPYDTCTKSTPGYNIGMTAQYTLINACVSPGAVIGNEYCLLSNRFMAMYVSTSSAPQYLSFSTELTCALSSSGTYYFPRYSGYSSAISVTRIV
jgi:hypothetical protein